MLAVLPFGNALATSMSLDFSCVSNTSSDNCGLGENQFSVLVDASDTGTSFKFTNTDSRQGSANPGITGIYFASSLLSDLSDKTVTLEIAGYLDFSLDLLSNPQPKLPASDKIEFDTAFSAYSNPDAKRNALEEGEVLVISILNLSESAFLKALFADFRIGLYASQFSDNGSESFATSARNQSSILDASIPPVPLPAAFWLFGTALAGIIGLSRRKKYI